MNYVSWEVVTAGHAPARPDWNCSLGCAAWPCDPAKTAMAETLPMETLLVLLHEAYGKAVMDADEPDLKQLYDRFVKWTGRVGVL